MTPDTKLVFGDIVQIKPDSKHVAFAGCMLVVTEPKGFGCQGYVTALGTRDEPGGLAYLRVSWEDMELVGHAIWAAGQPEEEEEDLPLHRRFVALLRNLLDVDPNAVEFILKEHGYRKQPLDQP